MELEGCSTSQEGERKEQRKGQLDEAKEPGSARQARGHQLWLRLRKSFRRAVEKIKNEEMKAAYLSHGLQHLRRITLPSPVRHVTHDCLQKVFVVLDAANILHVYKEDGFYLSSRRAPVPLTGLLYASRVEQFVAWDQSSLRVLDASFEVQSEVPSALPICCGLYSELLNRIVTAGDSNLTVWGFRYGSRNLQCCATVSDGLGPGAIFSRLALDTSGTKPQRCFAACDTGAAAFDISRGTLISFKTKLHSRVITDIAYCEAVGSPVTASRDTTIKVWDETWHIRTVFVGHTAPVMALTIYPQRPLIFSASQDGTIRTWNLDTVDQVDQLHVSEPVEALDTQHVSCVVSVSGTSFTLWKINKLYSLYVPLGSPAKHLSCVDLKPVANFPARLLCVCQDATVRVLDAPTGTVLAVLSLPPPSQVLDVAYCLPRETLFVLTESGSLLRVNAATDPMVVRKSIASWGSRPSCLLLYSHIVDPEKAYTAWLDVVANKSDRKDWQKLPFQMQDKNRYVLIMGQEDGLLTVVEWFSGRIQCQMEAHGSQRVTALAEYPSQTCIISAGADLTLKMWRVFPYAEESLLPLLCFSCAAPACHLCCLQHTLAVAFQDSETVTYSIVHYNLMEQTRCEHGPEDDPLDDITGLCCCPNLKLFASASRDGSVKVWNSQNKLLRHLKLNTIPESLAFANPEGDLFVGLERHLYLIRHNKYLPSYYNMTLLCARFLEPIRGSSLPLSKASFEILVQDNAKRLKQEPPPEETGSPLPGAHQVPPVQESQVLRDREVEAEASKALDLRDHDLQQLQMGKVRAIKKVRLTKEMREEAFERYLRTFYKQQPKVEIPEEDVFHADDVLEAIARCGSISELYGPSLSNMFLGAFPQLASLKAPPQELLQAASSPAGVGLAAASTFSVTPQPGLKEALYGRPQGGKKTSDQAEAKGRMPEPPAPPESKRPLPPLKKPSLDAPSDAVAASADEAPKWPETLRAPSLDGPFLETIFGKVKMPQDKFDRGLSLIPEDELRTSQTPSLPGSLAGSSIVNVMDTVRSEKSLRCEDLSMAVRSQESYKASRSFLRLRSQTSSQTIKGFFHEPVASRERIQIQTEPEGQLLLPKISSGFIPNSVVAQQLHAQEYLPSVERLVRVTEAPTEPQSPPRSSSVKMAGQDQQPGREPSREKPVSLSWSSIPESSSRVFLTQLDESHYPEDEERSQEQVSAFYLHFKDASWFKQLFPKDFPPGTDLVELLARLLSAMPMADFGTRTELLDAILSLREAWEPGMSDMVHTTLLGLLNVKRGAPSMQKEPEQRFVLATLHALLALNKDSRDLMVELMTYYLQAPPDCRLIIEGLIEETGVRDPHKYFYKEMDSWQVEKDGTKEEVQKVCSLWLEGAMQALQEHRVHLALKQKTRGKHVCRYSPKPRLSPSQWRDTQSVRPAEAVTYFAEGQLERQLVEEIQSFVALPEEMPRDTVMALPRLQKSQAILRLGETNAMLRNRISEHFYFPYIFPRYLMKGFVPFVKLPLPKINLNPFPSPLERPVSPKTFTQKQQLVQKYFIPKFSYADSYP